MNVDLIIANEQRKRKELEDMLRNDALRPRVTVEDYDAAREQLQREWQEQVRDDARVVLSMW